MFAIVSALTVAAGVAFAVPSGDKHAAARREMMCGSLLATGLMLLGVGLQSAGG